MRSPGLRGLKGLRQGELTLGWGAASGWSAPAFVDNRTDLGTVSSTTSNWVAQWECVARLNSRLSRSLSHTGRIWERRGLEWECERRGYTGPHCSPSVMSQKFAGVPGA
jgi:hypothetical protein